MQKDLNITTQPAAERNSWFDKLATLAIFFLLLLTLIIGTGEMIHGQLLRLGENMYGDPKTGLQYSFLRADPQQPTCERHGDIEAQVQQKVAESANDPDAQFFGIASPEEIRASLIGAQQQCEQKFQFYDNAKTFIDQHPSLKAYRTLETSFFWLFQFGTENRGLILVLMVVIASISATLHRHHIGLRPAMTRVDYLFHDGAMLLANLILAFATYKYLLSMNNSGVAVATKTLWINYLWIFCFVILAAISLYKLIKPEPARQAGGSVGKALLAIPLFAQMAILTGIAFIFFMDYSYGQAIYLGQLIEFSNIFLSLALLIWVGMLLTQTQVMDLFLNILRPWNLSPETLTWIILIAAAIPTAYTGASGIFVVAAGAIIYKEVWNSGARRQYALAVSAMSGSLGVVLRPCLLVVIIATLDSKHVTSDELFDHGIYVFWLTSLLFLAISLLLADSKFRVNSPVYAMPKMLQAIVPVLPYVFIILAVVYFYKYVLGTGLNEFTAPTILPLIMLAMVYYDKKRRKSVTTPAVDELSTANGHESKLSQPHGFTQKAGFMNAVNFATSETIGHIGALIMLMALSVSVGGLIEKTDIIHLLPTHLGGVSFSLFLIAMLLALIGMCTDPFGAVILVAATIAPVAYENGIHPIHFWMICLVAFELGYVTPPVALNHLLTRMSVGDDEVMQADREAKEKYTSFYYRYERWLLPIMVMFPALMLVTFAPYIFKMFGWYQ